MAEATAKQRVPKDGSSEISGDWLMSKYDNNFTLISDLLCNYPDAQAEIDEIRRTSEITMIYFGLAHGVTPSLFVIYTKDGDEYLERVRLIEKVK